MLEKVRADFGEHAVSIRDWESEGWVLRGGLGGVGMMVMMRGGKTNSGFRSMEATVVGVTDFANGCWSVDWYNVFSINTLLEYHL